MSTRAAARSAAVIRGWRFQRAEGPVAVVGDIHGHSDKLKALWDRLPKAVGGADAFEKLNVIFLGDYCDKGPDTKGVVDFMTSLEAEHPKQKHYFLAGNHDFALSAFLGLLPEKHTLPHSNYKEKWVTPKQADYSGTWKENYTPKFATETLYVGPGHERMHLQGVRYAGTPLSVFDSHVTFSSYGVDYGDRQGLIDAMPDSHKRFFADLRWIAKLRSSLGDILAVHAGLEDEPLANLDQTIQALRVRDPAFLHQAFIEPISGRANVERMPGALMPPILPKRGYLPPPLFLISGHHGFVRVHGRRIIVDMCSGHPDRDLCAVILDRGVPSPTHTQLSNDQGLDINIVTSSSPK